MAFSIVQHVGNNGTGTSVSVTCSATTAGNLLVAMIGITRNSPLGPDSFTALPPNWVQIGSTIDDLSWSEVTGGLFYLPNCSSGLTSFTWTILTAPNQWDIMLLEVSGAATASPLDVSNVTNTKVVHTSDTVSATTTANGDLILGLGVWDDLDVNPTAFNDGSGWTFIQSFSDINGWETLRAVYQTQTTAGAVSYSPSWTGNADDILWIVAFKAASSGVALSTTLVGEGTLTAGTPQLSTSLTGTLTGIGTLTAGAFSLKTSLTSVFAGIGTIQLNTSNSGAVTVLSDKLVSLAQMSDTQIALAVLAEKVI